MAGRRLTGRLMATAALTLPLWLASCVSGDPTPGRTFPAGATTVERTVPAQAPSVPIPQPQAPPPLVAGPAAPDPGEPASTPTPPATEGEAEHAGPSRAPALPEAGRLKPGSPTEPAPAPAAAPSPAAVPRPSPTPEPPAASSGEAASGTPARSAGTQTVTAYYVVLDDGGASGVRFGCNDSLAAVDISVAGPAEPLAGAMRALLDGSTAPGLYNSLTASTLTFLSGTFDGTTVTVYLSGTIRPGGACDIPRVEAQLTQTAVASVGAIRAEVYVNGSPLAEALRLD